jgi:hypothetical protein
MIARLLPALLLATATGCANSLRTIELEGGLERRDLTTASFEIHAPEGPLRTSLVVLEVEMEEVTVSSSTRTVRQVEEVTPYEAARELYEVPGGAVALPLAFVWNAVDVVLLGFIPNEVVEPFTSWSFAALNPFLNAESASRVEQRELGSRVLPATGETQRARRPAASQWLEVSLDGGPAVRMATDERGTLSLFLDELPWPRDLGIPHRVVATLPTADGEGARAEIELDGDFAEYLALNAAQPASRAR